MSGQIDVKKILIVLILVSLAGVNFFAGIGKCGLFDMDETVYSEVSREMAFTGNYLVPHFNGKPFLEKPALFYWAQAVTFKFFGAGDIQARVPSALASLLLLVLFYFLSKTVFGRTTALLSSMALAFNVLMGILSKAATTDAVLFLFVTVSIMCFLSAMFTGRKFLYYGFYACAAFAGLAKGPVGFLVPFTVALISAALAGQLKELKNAKPVTGLLLFFIILLPWYVSVSLETKGEFLREFFLKHNLARFGKPFEGHSGSVFYYVPVILFGFFPWSAFLFSAATKMGLTDRKNIYLAVWALVPFLLFSVSGTKLPNYILPVFAPLALITGLWLEKYLAGGEKAAVSLWFMVIMALAIGAVLFAADPIVKSVQLKFENPFLRQDISFGNETRFFAVIFFITVLAAGVFAVMKYRRTFIGIAAGSALLFNLFAGVYMVPRAWYFIQGGLHELALEARAMSSELAVFGIFNPSINFYSQKTSLIIAKEQPGELAKTAAEFKKAGRNLCIITDDSLAGFVPRRFLKIKAEPGYALYAEDKAAYSEPAAPPHEKWWGIYGVLRRMDLRMFFLINNFPGHPVIDYIMIFFTTLGNGLLLLPVVAAALYLHDRKKFAYNFVFFLIVVIAGGIFVQILKFIINSPRPLKRLDDVRVLLGPLSERGFPSGHTQAAFTAAFFLSTRIKKWAAVFFVCALIVGYSRIYVGAHFPSDVFAGACVGIVTTGVLMTLLEEKLNRKFTPRA